MNGPTIQLRVRALVRAMRNLPPKKTVRVSTPRRPGFTFLT